MSPLNLNGFYRAQGANRRNRAICGKQIKQNFLQVVKAIISVIFGNDNYKKIKT